MSKRSRKLRLHYWVGNDIDLWWCPNINKWITLEELNTLGVQGLCQRQFRTKQKAFAHASYMGTGFYITQFNPHYGKKMGAGWKIKTWSVL